MRGLGSMKKLKSVLYVAASAFGAYGVVNFYNNNPENAHKLGILVSKYRLIPKSTYEDPDSLKITLFGKEFKNPVGIAAGFDKNAEAVLGLRDIGFGLIEIGSVTPEAQPGNEKPRVFRLSDDLAVINRYGFNSDGHDIVAERLRHIKNNKDCDSIVVGVNLGKNKTSVDPISDYVIGIEKLGPLSDYLVINISSPNTPGLRSMQNKNVLTTLLKATVDARNNLPEHYRPPLLLKLAPDLSHDELEDIAKIVTEEKTKIDGLVVCNTTVARPDFLVNQTLTKDEAGGLSGKPLKDISTQMISTMYQLTNGEIPIIGVGGIFTGSDAYDKIKAGASVVQLYTSLVYEGPPVVAKIKKELVELLEKDGYQSISEAVGASVKKAL